MFKPHILASFLLKYGSSYNVKGYSDKYIAKSDVLPSFLSHSTTYDRKLIPFLEDILPIPPTFASVFLPFSILNKPLICFTFTYGT